MPVAANGIGSEISQEFVFRILSRISSYWNKNLDIDRGTRFKRVLIAFCE